MIRLKEKLCAMKLTNNNLDKIGKANPFQVPDGYFANLSDIIISQLPEKGIKKPQVVNMWHRVQPLIYLAAMFTGIVLIFKFFVNEPQTSKILSEDINNISISEIDDFNSYYQERMAYSSYQQILYAEEDVDFF